MAEPKRKATYDDVLAAPEHKVAEILRDAVAVDVPDLAGWRRERMPRIPNAPWIGGPFDREPRDPAGPGGWRILDEPELLALDGQRWVVAENHGGNDVVRAEPFAAVELDLNRLWID